MRNTTRLSITVLAAAISFTLSPPLRAGGTKLWRTSEPRHVGPWWHDAQRDARDDEDDG